MENCPVSRGKHASSDERQKVNDNRSTLVYGEITFRSYAIALEKIKNKYGGLQEPGGIFYDLGSGTSKPALSSALLHDFDAVRGIELLEGLYNISVELAETWKTNILPCPPRASKTWVSACHTIADGALCFSFPDSHRPLLTCLVLFLAD